jgi:putative transposase
MILAYRIELQPTATQRRMFLQHAGNARWAYNWGLRRKQDAWALRKAALDAGIEKAEAPKVPTAVDLHRELNVLKKLPAESGGVPWMYEASKCAPQEALRCLDVAFDAFFRRVKVGEKPGFPRFKSRSRGVGGFGLTGVIKASAKTVRLPRIGRVRVKSGDHGHVPEGAYAAAWVTEEAGRWYLSVRGTEERAEAAPNGGPAVGVDLGIARLATLSDGTVVENPRAWNRLSKKLRRRQRDVSRKRKGSRKRRKAVAALQRAHRWIRNLRKDTIHKLTTSLTKSHGRVVVESLRVKAMTRRGSGEGRKAKARLNRSILDAGWGVLLGQLEYKAKLYGCELVRVDPRYTSQRCSCCGRVDAANRRSQAVFVCTGCGFAANADTNAARNILVAGSCPGTVNASGAARKTPTSGQAAMKLESV